MANRLEQITALFLESGIDIEKELIKFAERNPGVTPTEEQLVNILRNTITSEKLRLLYGMIGIQMWGLIKTGRSKIKKRRTRLA